MIQKKMKALLTFFVTFQLLILNSCARKAQVKTVAEMPDRVVSEDALDVRIPAVDARHIRRRDGAEWLNPYLVISPEGIELTSQPVGIERRLIARNDLKRALISLPLEAWPYGRVVATQHPKSKHMRLAQTSSF